MADFFQNGVITTLQRLGDRPIENLEQELKRLTQTRRTVLLLPALYSEFEGAAMPRIVEQLTGLEYLYRIVLSLDRATEQEFKKVKEIMSVLSGEVRIVWHDGPRMKKLLKELKRADFKVDMPGKGRSVWMTLGYITTVISLITEGISSPNSSTRLSTLGRISNSARVTMPGSRTSFTAE
jgi:glucosyl-3-phosphoglycerate synthase